MTRPGTDSEHALAARVVELETQLGLARLELETRYRATDADSRRQRAEMPRGTGWKISQARAGAYLGALAIITGRDLLELLAELKKDERTSDTIHAEMLELLRPYAPAAVVVTGRTVTELYRLALDGSRQGTIPDSVTGPVFELYAEWRRG